MSSEKPILKRSTARLASQREDYEEIQAKRPPLSQETSPSQETVPTVIDSDNSDIESLNDVLSEHSNSSTQNEDRQDDEDGASNTSESSSSDSESSASEDDVENILMKLIRNCKNKILLQDKKQELLESNHELDQIKEKIDNQIKYLDLCDRDCEALDKLENADHPTISNTNYSENERRANITTILEEIRNSHVKKWITEDALDLNVPFNVTTRQLILKFSYNTESDNVRQRSEPPRDQDSSNEEHGIIIDLIMVFIDTCHNIGLLQKISQMQSIHPLIVKKCTDQIRFVENHTIYVKTKSKIKEADEQKIPKPDYKDEERIPEIKQILSELKSKDPDILNFIREYVMSSDKWSSTIKDILKSPEYGPTHTTIKHIETIVIESSYDEAEATSLIGSDTESELSDHS